MADFLKHVFPNHAFTEIPRSNKQINDVNKDIFGICSVYACDRSLLVGDIGSGKTSLLFQCALSYAMEGENVTFITPYKLESMPLLIEGARQPDHKVMRQVQIMYLNDRTSLLKYLSSIHSKSPLPRVILVNKLDHYINQTQVTDRSRIVAETCAYLQDAISFLQTKLNAVGLADTSIRCVLGASVSTSGSLDSPLLDIYQQFIPNIFRISVVSRERRIFQVTNTETEQTMKQTVNYVIGKDSINLYKDYNIQEVIQT